LCGSIPCGRTFSPCINQEGAESCAKERGDEVRPGGKVNLRDPVPSPSRFCVGETSVGKKRTRLTEQAPKRARHRNNVGGDGGNAENLQGDKRRLFQLRKINGEESERTLEDTSCRVSAGAVGGFFIAIAFVPSLKKTSDGWALTTRMHCKATNWSTAG